MLNPTGLQGTFGNVNSAYDIGEGLRERRRWLKDGLDSFAECYGGPGTSVGVCRILLCTPRSIPSKKYIKILTRIPRPQSSSN